MSTQTDTAESMEVEHSHPKGPPRPPKGGLSPYGPVRKKESTLLLEPHPKPPPSPPASVSAKRPAADPVGQREREMAQAFAKARRPTEVSVAASSNHPPPPPPPGAGVIAPHVSTERHRQPKRNPEHGVAAEQEALLHSHLRQQEHIEGVRARHTARGSAASSSAASVSVARARATKRMADLDIGPVKRRTHQGRGHFESLNQPGHKLGHAHIFPGTAHRLV